MFAPRVETALSGAGWQANGSESVEVRERLDAEFGGAGAYALQVAVHSRQLTFEAPAFRRSIEGVERVLAASPAVGDVLPAPIRPHHLPRRPHDDRRRHGGEGPQRDGRRGKRPQGPSRRRHGAAGRGRPHRCRRHVVGLQRGQPRGDDEVRADLLARDAGDPRARLRLAGRGRPAADADDRRPGRLGRSPLPGHRAGADLHLGHELRADVRPGFGDRLRALHRHAVPQRPVRSGTRSRRGGGGDDGHRREGGAPLRPDGADLALRRDARPQPRFPFDVDRHHGRGSLRPRGDADPAPAVLARLGPLVDKLALPWAHGGDHRSPALRAGESVSGAGRSCSAGLRWWCCSPLRCRC